MSEGHACILLHVRRTTVEDAYIAVPADSAMKTQPEADGTYRIDFERLVAEAARLSAEPSVQWGEEERRVEAHPVQQPVPAGRKVFDVHSG